ncbi:MAG TPA: efflux RND transporter periplasmic adaptor subunit [Verrucomicrobiae bacterium]
MFRKYIIPLVAVAGVAFAVFTVVRGDKTPPSAPPVSEAPQSPYRTSVAGSGIVEASTENISVGTQIAGIVSKIFVEIGSDVKAGDPLFKIDDRSLLAELNVRRAAVQVAEAQLADVKYHFTLAEALGPGTNTSMKEYQTQRFALQKAEAQLAQSRAELESSETNLTRLTVRAPVNGQVLQLKVHPGEFAPVTATGAGQPPLILLGSVTPLHVRVDVDENDAWRVRRGAAATGYLRGNKNIKTPLTFVRFEPYVVPKKSLTGDSAERVDTRVLQVIFSFERRDLPIYVGQQMDVFINLPETVQNGSATATKN